jgi:hypothetical protein
MNAEPSEPGPPCELRLDSERDGLRNKTTAGRLPNTPLVIETCSDDGPNVITDVDQGGRHWSRKENLIDDMTDSSSDTELIFP